MDSGIQVELSWLRGAPKEVCDFFAPFILEQVKPTLEVLDPEKLAEYRRNRDWWVWGWRVWNLDA